MLLHSAECKGKSKLTSPYIFDSERNASGRLLCLLRCVQFIVNVTILKLSFVSQVTARTAFSRNNQNLLTNNCVVKDNKPGYALQKTPEKL